MHVSVGTNLLNSHRLLQSAFILDGVSRHKGIHSGTVGLPPELQRLLKTIQDLDERAQGAVRLGYICTHKINDVTTAFMADMASESLHTSVDMLVYCCSADRSNSRQCG